MSMGIRLLLLVCAIALFAFVLRSIRKSKMRIEDSLFWFALSALILLLAIFPGIAYAAAGLFQFQAPVNFVFLAFIAILLIKCFTMSIHASQLETKIRELTEQIAIEQLENHDRNASKKAE